MSPADRPPRWVWWIPAGVAALRMLPLLALERWPLPAGHVSLGVSYLQKDFLQYAAFARQASEGALLLANPYTTEPQSPRFLLLFHLALGLVARATGLAPAEVLEWSRVPLAFAFFATLWWFLRPFLPDRRERAWAAVLAGFATGLEGWLRPLAAWLPPAWAERFVEDTWALHGWNLFASFYNPLWIAALTAALWVLRPLLVGHERTPRAFAGLTAKLLLVYAIHPYTAIGTLAIAAVQPLVTLAVRERPDWRRHLADGTALAVGLLAIGALNLWQMQDAVYRRAAAGLFGSQTLSVLWYPITLGLLAVLAWRGARRWPVERRAERRALLGWIVAIALLHSVPILNGYKFVFLLPLPLCILAAPAVRALAEGLRGPALRPRLVAIGAALGLFGGVAFQTAADIQRTRAACATPADLMAVVRELATLPAGNTLAPAAVGTVIPAYAPQRVWVGHWFLTPGHDAREERYRRMLSTRRAAPQLRQLVAEQQIRYVVAPTPNAVLVAEGLGAAVAERRRHGQLELLVLR